MTHLDPETWLDLHGDYLYRYAIVRVRKVELAEDLVQETLAAAIKARHAFAGESSERTWLVSILRRKIVDDLRKQFKEREAVERSSPDDTSEMFFDSKGLWLDRPAKWSADPQRLLIDREFWDAFLHCLSHLPVRAADSFSLRELEGLSGEKVCEVLGISPSNFWTQLYRARMLLRKCLEENWFGGTTVAKSK